MAAVEFEVKDKLISKLISTNDDLMFQIRTMKTVLQVPRLRQQMNYYDF